MIGRFSTVSWIVFFVLAASALYLVKYRVQDVKDEVRALEQRIALEAESAELLRAEWAYLNRPERLQALADRYLQLRGISPEQIVALDALPQPQQEIAASQQKQLLIREAE